MAAPKKKAPAKASKPAKATPKPPKKAEAPLGLRARLMNCHSFPPGPGLIEAKK